MCSFKVIALIVVVACVNALPQYHQQASSVYGHIGNAHYAHPAPIVEHVAPAHYNFGYSVHDPHTHDVKEQEETRDGYHVRGHYSLVEPDGTRRVVHYTADPHNGFNAVVQHQGHAVHPAPVTHHATHVAAPVAQHAVPTVSNYAAPVIADHASAAASQSNFNLNQGNAHNYHH